MAIELGDKVRDKVTGYTGIAIGVTQWLYGCKRWVIQTTVDKDGKVPDSVNVDDGQVELVESQRHKNPSDNGGFDIVPSRPNVRRN